MRNMRRHAILLASVAVVLTMACPAWARGRGGPRWSIGVNFGVPCYHRPYPYYRPVIVAPPPPVYYPAPVVVQPAPVVAVPAAVPSVAARGYEAPPPQQQNEPPVLEQPVQVSRPVSVSSNCNPADLTALNDPSPDVRADAVIRLGRSRDRRAVPSLIRSLNEDGSPQVREAAARALGLIAAPQALAALHNAAQADQDRDVRRSASFAAEVIRANSSQR